MEKQSSLIAQNSKQIDSMFNEHHYRKREIKRQEKERYTVQENHLSDLDEQSLDKIVSKRLHRERELPVHHTSNSKLYHDDKPKGSNKNYYDSMHREQMMPHRQKGADAPNHLKRYQSKSRMEDQYSPRANYANT